MGEHWYEGKVRVLTLFEKLKNKIVLEQISGIGKVLVLHLAAPLSEFC